MRFNYLRSRAGKAIKGNLVFCCHLGYSISMGRGSRKNKECATRILDKQSDNSLHYFTKNGLHVIQGANHIPDEEIDKITGQLFEDWNILKSEAKKQLIKPLDEDMSIIDPDNFSLDSHTRTAIMHSLRTKYGELFEEAAFSLAKIAYGATKPEKIRSASSKNTLTEGHDFNIDIIIDDIITRYQVECKSSDNWGNQASHKGTHRKFQEGARKFRKEYPKEEGFRSKGPINVVVCRKGQTSPLKTSFDYYQLAGDDYWHFITGDKDMRSRWLQSLRRFAG